MERPGPEAVRSRVNEERVAAVARMDIAVRWLALELPADVWDDLNVRWQDVKVYLE